MLLYKLLSSIHCHYCHYFAAAASWTKGVTIRIFHLVGKGRAGEFLRQQNGICFRDLIIRENTGSRMTRRGTACFDGFRDANFTQFKQRLAACDNSGL